jgi:hypothetical protein
MEMTVDGLGGGSDGVLKKRLDITGSSLQLSLPSLLPAPSMVSLLVLFNVYHL